MLNIPYLKFDILDPREMKHEIEEENQRPHPDDFRIAELKRQKLRIKDEIALLETEEKHVSA